MKSIKPMPFKRRCDRLEEHILNEPEPLKRKAMQSIATALGCGGSLRKLQECIMSRVSTDVSTLQVNHPHNVTYRVAMSYEDRAEKPQNGYLYPSRRAVYIADELDTAVAVTYLRLSKQFGRFV